MRHTILTIDIHYIHGQSQGLLMQQFVNKVFFFSLNKPGFQRGKLVTFPLKVLPLYVEKRGPIPRYAVKSPFFSYA